MNTLRMVEGVVRNVLVYRRLKRSWFARKAPYMAPAIGVPIAAAIGYFLYRRRYD